MCTVGTKIWWVWSTKLCTAEYKYGYGARSCSTLSAFCSRSDILSTFCELREWAANFCLKTVVTTVYQLNDSKKITLTWLYKEHPLTTMLHYVETVFSFPLSILCGTYRWRNLKWNRLEGKHWRTWNFGNTSTDHNMALIIIVYNNCLVGLILSVDIHLNSANKITGLPGH